MQFSDTSTKQGILQECESALFDNNYGKITGDTVLLDTFVRYANMACKKVSQLILRYDNSWEFMDSNSTNLSMEDHNLVSGQADYTLETTHLKVLKVRVKDPSGNYITLRQISRRELTDSEIAATGTPSQYDLLGSSVFLYPIPNYSSTLGLEIQIQSELEAFTSSDTTKEPGFNSMFHPLVPMWMCYYYAFRKKLETAKDFRQEILVMEEELKETINQRDYGKPHNFSMQKEDYGSGALGSMDTSPKAMYI